MGQCSQIATEGIQLSLLRILASVEGGGGRCAAVVFTFVSHGYYMTGCNTEVKGFTWRA